MQYGIHQRSAEKLFYNTISNINPKNKANTVFALTYP